MTKIRALRFNDGKYLNRRHTANAAFQSCGVIDGDGLLVIDFIGPEEHPVHAILSVTCEMVDVCN